MQGLGASLLLMAVCAKRGQAWYHADFCHAYAWVYEDGDKLLVKWGERDGTDLYLHRESECPRCCELSGNRAEGRHGEFHMEKPDAEFSSTVSFFVVLAEIAKWVPGLADESDPSPSPVPAPTPTPDPSPHIGATSSATRGAGSKPA